MPADRRILPVPLGSDDIGAMDGMV